MLNDSIPRKTLITERKHFEICYFVKLLGQIRSNLALIYNENTFKKNSCADLEIYGTNGHKATIYHDCSNEFDSLENKVTSLFSYVSKGKA